MCTFIRNTDIFKYISGNWIEKIVYLKKVHVKKQRTSDKHVIRSVIFFFLRTMNDYDIFVPHSQLFLDLHIYFKIPRLIFIFCRAEVFVMSIECI